MKITFISQASVIIETSDTTIWTDPWLFGTAFNDSWKLFPSPNFDEKWYSKITHLWVSHEHPDHFHLPTLKSLPQNFKDRVTLLFQKNNSEKMPNAFKNLGFKNIQLLKNRAIVDLTKNTRVHNFQVGQMDSSLAVLHKDKTVLNLNDCEINKQDALRFVGDLGEIDVVLNQFSMAGYAGHIDYKTHLKKQGDIILNNMIENHQDLGAKTTIPIASYIYFCMEDNSYMNSFGNRPEDIYKKFKENDLECRFLSVNESFDLDNPEKHDIEESYQRMKRLFDTREEIKCDPLVSVTYEQISEAFLERATQISAYYPNFILKKLGKIRAFVPDLNIGVEFSIRNKSFGKYEMKNTNDFDMQVNSQPLFFAFKFKWGLQTLGVSARYFIQNRFEVWKWYRIVTSMNNAEVYLKPKFLFSKANISYFISKYNGLLNQIRYQLSRM